MRCEMVPGPPASRGARKIVRTLSARAGAFVGLLAALLMLGPAFWGSGFLLRFDMVFTPHLALSPATLGVDGSVPRAVPNDIVVALLDLALPGWATQRLVLIGAFIAMGAAFDRVRPFDGQSFSPLARAAGAAAACWNPWIAERLLIGHWGYLWGYAGLLWVLAAYLPAGCGRSQRRAHTPGALPREDHPGSVHSRSARSRPAELPAACSSAARHHEWMPRTACVGLLLASLSGSTGAVLALVAFVVMALGRSTLRHVVLVCLLWLALNAVWWWPFLTSTAHSADAWGVQAFAAKAESPLGPLASVLGGGGIWHAASVPLERTSALVVALSAVATILATLALKDARASLLAMLGAVLAVWGSSPLANWLTWVVLHVPGGGLLRDGHKFSALTLGVAAFGVTAVIGRATAPQDRATLWRSVGVMPRWLPALALVVPLTLLPSMLWGKLGDLTSHRYPASVTSAAEWLNAHSEPDERTAVLPWTLYRRYAWNNDVTVLDPWPRLLDDPVVLNDDLPLQRGAVRGENPIAARLSSAASSGRADVLARALAESGVRFVVVQKDQPQDWLSHAATWQQVVSPQACTTRVSTEDVRVCELSGPQPQQGVRPKAVLGLVCSAGAYLMMLLWLVRNRGRARVAAYHPHDPGGTTRIRA